MNGDPQQVDNASELEKARQLLSASAIRALSEDGWNRPRPWLDIPVLVLFLAVMTAVMAPSWFGSHPVPPINSIAEHTIRAERDLLVEDKEATELSRAKAAQSVLPVYTYDPDLYFEIGEKIYAAVEAMVARKTAATLSVQDRREAFAADLGQPVNAATFELIENLDHPNDLAVAMNFFLNIVLDRMVVSARGDLPSRGGLQIHTLLDDSRRPFYSLSGILDLRQVRRLMRARAGDAPYGSARIVRTWVLETAAALVRPNFTPNPRATEEARVEASKAVEPVFVRINQGEVLVREGDRVTAAIQDRIRLHNAGLENRPLWGEALAFAVLLVALITLGGAFFRGARRPFRFGRKAAYLSLSVVAMAAFLCVGVYFAGRGLAEGLSFGPEAAPLLMPVALVTVLISLLVDSRTSLLAGIGLVLVLAYRVDADAWLITYFVTGVLAAGVIARRCRRRSDLLKAGIAIGVVQAVMVPIVFVLSGQALDAAVVPAVVCAVASGALVAICSTGLLPVLEHVFDEATDMRLLELASGDNPLLKQLALRSPGTYYHSVMIGNLAEAAADVIGCNALQCRVMALYHDLGKMRRPSYFAENQRGGNIHDRLPPELSARIIFAHIKDGIDIARKHRLGRVIVDAVTQHQGTTLLRVFYMKAQERAKETGATVNEQDFRYPGPRPHSKEAGILLLADSVEAATRALKDPTPQDVQTRVQSVINEKVGDHQLDECALTLADLAAIEAAFTRVLTLGVYHSRIEYPPPPTLAASHHQQPHGHSDLDRRRSVAKRPS